MYIVGGLPGSGKSYYVANYIATKYGKWNKLYRTFFFEKEMLIFSNLDGLTLEHRTILDAINKAGGVEKFFTVPNFEKIREHYPHHKIILIIDEAQNIFHDKFRNRDVEYFFEYHRHLGLEIFLCTNNIPAFSRQIVGLSENIIQAQPRSTKIPGVFRYKYIDKVGTFLFSEVITSKPEVFSIYKSFTHSEHTKPKNIILHWIIVFFVVASVSAVGFKAFATHFKNKGKPKDKIAPAVAPATPVAPSPSQPIAAVQQQHSSVRPDLLAAVAGAPQPVFIGWRTYPVDGFIKSGNKRLYMVRGVILDTAKCRNYDPDLKTVEFYGPEVPERRPGGAGAIGTSATLAGSPAESRNDSGGVASSPGDAYMNPSKEFYDNKTVHLSDKKQRVVVSE